MQNSNTQRTSLSPYAIGLTVLALLVALFSFPLQTAGAVTSGEKYAEADALMSTVDSLQTQMNQATDTYNASVAEHAAATKAMEEAQARIDAAQKRITELQERLAERANSMYKSGPSTFLDVLLGATSFEEFASSWDLVERITGQDAALVQEMKDVRAEAEAAHAEFSAQQAKAAEEMKRAEEARNAIASSQAALQAQISSITAEAASLAASEAAAAEAAAHAAEEAAKNSGSWTPPSAAGASRLSGSGILNHPCPGAAFSSSFGPRWGAMHEGIDLSAGEGTPYYAAESGTVLYASNGGGWNGGAGNWIVLIHGNGMSTVYMHSSVTYVSPGQYVTRGQNIGAVGNTGDSYGAHLHFEVRLGGYRGTAVDPCAYI